jgi:hypothetical protein
MRRRHWSLWPWSWPAWLYSWWPTGLIGDVNCLDTVAVPHATSRSRPEPDCVPTVAVVWVSLDMIAFPAGWSTRCRLHPTRFWPYPGSLLVGYPSHPYCAGQWGCMYPYRLAGRLVRHARGWMLQIKAEWQHPPAATTRYSRRCWKPEKAWDNPKD